MVIAVLGILYGFDLISYLFSKSTRRMRARHYWVNKLPSTDATNLDADVVTKSYQYLPGKLVIIGSFPVYFSMLGFIWILEYFSDREFWFQVVLAVVIYSLIDYSLGWLLRAYCVVRNSKQKALDLH